MIGAIITQLTVIDPVWALLPAVFGVVLALIARARWPQTKALVGKLKRVETGRSAS
jgi:hypothetical protein